MGDITALAVSISFVALIASALVIISIRILRKYKTIQHLPERLIESN